VALYLGEVGGRPVTTGLGVRAGDHVGVFNVATPPEQRGRGFGSAITAGIVAAAVADGARWAWLQSSTAGHGIYRRLGFVDVAVWECWVGG
jgi:predicted GNAT family acetyltransferase